MEIGHATAVGGLRCGIVTPARRHTGTKAGTCMGSPPMQKIGGLGTWSSPVGLMEAGRLVQEGLGVGKSRQGGGVSDCGRDVVVSRRGHAQARGKVVAGLKVKAFQGGSMFLGAGCWKTAEATCRRRGLGQVKRGVTVLSRERRHLWRGRAHQWFRGGKGRDVVVATRTCAEL